MSEAFISYSRADSAFADKLGEDLEKRGIAVWIDRESIEGGAAWRALLVGCDFRLPGAHRLQRPW